jgi:hypothetical protein
MFGDFDAGSIKSAQDEFGCKFTLERLTAARFRLMRFLTETSFYEDPTDSSLKGLQLLREALPAIRSLVEELLKKISQRSSCQSGVASRSQFYRFLAPL